MGALSPDPVTIAGAAELQPGRWRTQEE